MKMEKFRQTNGPIAHKDTNQVVQTSQFVIAFVEILAKMIKRLASLVMGKTHFILRARFSRNKKKEVYSKNIGLYSLVKNFTAIRTRAMLNIRR